MPFGPGNSASLTQFRRLCKLCRDDFHARGPRGIAGHSLPVRGGFDGTMLGE